MHAATRGRYINSDSRFLVPQHRHRASAVVVLLRFEIYIVKVLTPKKLVDGGSRMLVINFYNCVGSRDNAVHAAGIRLLMTLGRKFHGGETKNVCDRENLPSFLSTCA